MAKKSPYNRDVFVNGLIAVYKKNCERKGEPENICTFISYCIDCKIITDSTINQFAVLKEFERLYPENNNHKAKTVVEISIMTGLGETRIWSILKNHANRFRPLRAKPPQ